MKIERLDDGKIKVVLTVSDLMRLNIEFENIPPKSPQMDELIMKIVNAIGKETGVFIEEGKIMLEMGKHDGTAVVVISKISDKRGSLLNGKISRLFFELPDCDTLFMMLSVIDEKFLEKMNIYQYKFGFYVSIPRIPLPVILWEFSEKCKKSKITEVVLSEHGRLIATGEQVVIMAREIKKLFRS